MSKTQTPKHRPYGLIISAAVVASVLAIGTPMSAQAATYPSDSTPPDLNGILGGFSDYWTSNGTNDLHGSVKNAAVLQYNDKIASWINQNATQAEKFKALQDNEYQVGNATYDQSLTVSTGLGSLLSKIYVQGYNTGQLPLTVALINSSNGSAGAFVGTSVPKAFFSYPRPYLPSNTDAVSVPGDVAGCAATGNANASSLKAIRVGKSYADSEGNLDITRVAPVIDTTKQFSPNDVALDPNYGDASTGICLGGAFPSGHTTTAYQAGITLATLVPELAPEILARASEGGNDRIVLGVHYPLDIVGGRIAGEAALATRWSDPSFVTGAFEPARAELLAYFQKETGHPLSWDIAHEKAYTSNPYGGKSLPGGTSEIVTNRKSAVKVYTERATYGFAKTGTKGLKASVPTGAENLLLTTFPNLTSAQRISVLAQTELASGYPLDQSGTTTGSWERLNLAAAMSATVKVSSNGSVKVTKVGGTARVELPPTKHHHNATF
jgi:membrane-associated phospholipid phosphatase